MFVDNSLIKKDTSRPDLFKSEVVSQPLDEKQKDGDNPEQKKKLPEEDK